jgi:hypothetical protein
MIVALAGLAIVTSGLAVATTAMASDPAELDGTLMVAHGGDRATGKVSMFAEMRTNSGRVKVRVSAANHGRLMKNAGKRVSMRGSKTDEGFAPTEIAALGGGSVSAAAAPALGGAPGARNIAVVVLRRKGTTADPNLVTNVQNAFFGTSGSTVANWFNEASSGQMPMTGRVFGNYESDYVAPSGCNGSSVLNGFKAEAESKAARDGYRADDFQHVVVVHAQSLPGCGFAGIAWIGANGVLLNATYSMSVAVHELGHNLGAWHAGTCAGTNAWSADCDLVDYGDTFDVMGTSSRHFSAAHKRRIGWIPSGEVATVSNGSQVVTLVSSTSLSGPGTRVLDVPRGDGSLFTVERRTSSGFDNGATGTWIRYIPPSGVRGSDDTVLVDMVPNTTSKNDGYLTPGNQFTDQQKKITIKLLSESGNSAQVQVCFGTCSTNPTTSTTTSTTSTTPTSSSSSSTSTSTSTTSTTVAPPNTVTVGFASGRVVVNGTAGNDNMRMWKVGSRRYVTANGAAMASVSKYCSIIGATVECKKEGSFAVYAGAGNDTVKVEGRYGRRVLIDGGGGNDTFVGAESADTFTGGTGSDQVNYMDREEGTVAVFIGGGPKSGRRGEHDDIEGDVENVMMP